MKYNQEHRFDRSMNKKLRDKRSRFWSICFALKECPEIYFDPLFKDYPLP